MWREGILRQSPEQSNKNLDNSMLPAGDSGKVETGRERLPKRALYSLDTDGGSGERCELTAVLR